MKKLTIFLAFLLFVGFTVRAQMQISGKVTGAEDGLSIPGVSVVVKGNTTIGTTTNVDGEYSLTVPSEAETLVFSFVGMKTQEVLISRRSVIDVHMEAEVLEMGEVVVTALGISREKKSLGYSVQEIGGVAVNKVRETNFVSSLSGKVSGVSIKQPNTMGGSTNIVIRGNASLLGNNQALFVIDGVPVDNSNTNTDNQMTGRGGFDYGNAASDINPDDIESISVLKGAAASALYGSRASNGVILITTKKGKKNEGIGITVNSSVVWSKINKNTFPSYQKEYGGSYGPYYDTPDGYFLLQDMDGDGVEDYVVPTYDDASWGAKFDPDLMVVHWDAMDPLADNYGEKTPWVYPENDAIEFFETGIKYTNNIAISAGNEEGAFRLSYTNVDEEGIMPNSSLERNTFNFTGSYELTDKFKVEANANYIRNEAIGRFGTGYDEQNPMQVFGQWYQTNVDIKKLENYKSPIDGSHRSWNYISVPDENSLPVVFYANNPYWVRYENYNNDSRNRFFGYAKLTYDVFDWLVAEGRISNDFYSELQERRIAIGSAVAGELPDYTRYDRDFNEWNADLMLRFNKDVSDLSFNGIVGMSTRKNMVTSILVTTDGGLALPNYFSLDNSVAPIITEEEEIEKNINSFYGSLSTGYKRFVFVDVTARYDISSTLPDDENSYFYPSISMSFMLSELASLKDIRYISLLKIRANYAEVGADAPVYNTKNSYFTGRPWGSLGLFSVKNTLYNPDLKSERTESIELGLEANFFNNRLEFDFSYYKNSTFDQIIALPVSFASGNSAMYINAGEIENKGYELTLNAVPVQIKDFSWNFSVNWFTNKNKVVDLGDDVDNILLFSAWDVSINAREGEAYGAIVGTDFVYHDGKKVVGDNGFYLRTDEEKVIGNINPDWNAGITNIFSYKNITLSALIDIQQGGDIYSVNMKHGLATGLYEETAGLNELGNPKRDPVSEGGGIILPNTVYEDGTPNITRIEAGEWGTAYNYDASPTARYIYDASYIKLREVSLSYNLPHSLLKKTFIKKASVAFVGRNLWIIDKETKHFDPEAALSSGNQQGIEHGTYPTTRTFGFNLNIGF